MPKNTAAHNLMGMALQRLGRLDEALASFDQAILCNPHLAAAHGGRAETLLDLGRTEEAVDSFDRALQIDPDAAGDWCNRGTALQSLQRFEQAIASYDRAIALAPNLVAAYLNRAGSLVHLRRYDDALADYDKALRIAPHAADALHKRGRLLLRVGRAGAAMADFDKAAEVAPSRADVFAGRAMALYDLGRCDDALASVERALAIDPRDTDALYTQANILMALKRHAAAAAVLDAVLAFKPGHRLAYGAALWCRLNCCDWSAGSDFEAGMRDQLVRNRAIFSPMVVVATVDDASGQVPFIKAFAEYEIPPVPAPHQTRRGGKADRIHVGYFGSDFHDHAMAYLTTELFEHHDRSRFEVTAISFAHDDRSDMRARLVRAFDRFVDARAKSDRDVQKLIGDLKIDICVDLTGFTTESRTPLLAARPAPIQVSWLGFPGTSGSCIYDYLIADETVIPPEAREYYSEQVVYLPHSYQANMRHRPSSPAPFSRSDFGLPDDAFVFCCFNNSWKLSPRMFNIWMRLLRNVDRSVLWLLDANKDAVVNLRAAAASCGVDPGRLVFAPRVPAGDHLARHRLADLFLDTLPFNAHTTASDALWAGLPVLTCAGQSFAGRVGASLLPAIGLDELVTHSLEDYEALALRLARHPDRLAGIKRKLAVNRETHALFDIDRFRRGIEVAYSTMIDIWRNGERPRAFRV